jgi:hypothetical protein
MSGLINEFTIEAVFEFRSNFFMEHKGQCTLTKELPATVPEEQIIEL